MRHLYHGKTSVCSAKVRVGLAELGLDWEGTILDLGASDQNSDWYLKINPKGVVPALVDDGRIVAESSVILSHLDRSAADRSLTPSDPDLRTQAEMWLADCIDIHAAINTMTFATSKRKTILRNKTPEQIEASIARMANPFNALKRRSILADGMNSPFVPAAFFTLRLMFERMSKALADSPWLLGEDYSIADSAVIAYVDRLDRLGLAGFWEGRYAGVGAWLERSRERPSYEVAIGEYAGPFRDDREKASANWDEVAPLWKDFLTA